MIELVVADTLAVSPLAFITAMQLLQVRFELSRHAHNLHDMCLLEQDLPLFVLIPLKVCQGDCSLKSW